MPVEKCLNRREALAILLALPFATVSACKRKYRRPPGDINLGGVQDLLYEKQIVRDRDILVIRDLAGWASMSTQCTFDGCGLSYQDLKFVCMCCGSSFDHNGIVTHGPATDPLPFFKMRYADGNLYTDAGEVVSPDTRFTTPEIEAALQRLGERIRKEGTRSGMQIPSILLGAGDGEESGKMFDEKPLTPKPTPSTGE